MYLNDNEYLDIERLREDLKNDSLGAFYGGGFGAALIDGFEIENASPKELINIAEDRNIDITKYLESTKEDEQTNSLKFF